MGKRKSLSKKTRFDVFKRDGFTCVYCGGQPPKVILHCDHVVAVANGGENEIDNLVTACDACNMGKGARELTSVPLTIAEKTIVLREREEQIAAFNELLAEKRDRIEETAWIVANAFLDAWGEERDSFRRDWLASISRFVDALPLDEVLEAVGIGTRRFERSQGKAFKYFCGVCWRKIRGPQ